MKKGLLIIISGPSGVGKGAIRQQIMKDNSLNLWFSVSMTTRSIREGEKNGREYFFVTKDEFLKTLNEGGLLEYNKYVENYYGTPKAKVEEMRNAGYNVLLEIDVNGAEKVMKALGKENVLSVFILPPSLEELENRIRGRQTETSEVIAKRMVQARKELELRKDYRYAVVNDDLERCAKEIISLIKFEAAKDC